MEKIKRNFVGAILCMVFMMFSSDVAAQTFVDGATANTRLSQELPVLKSAYKVLDRASATFIADANDIAMKFSAVEQLIASLESSSSPADVASFLQEVVQDKSEEFVNVDAEMYDIENFGSTEITDLHSYLKGILTN